MNTHAQKVIDACEASFEHFKNDCSGFVKDVVKKASGIALEGNADGLVTFLQNSPDGWQALKDGDGKMAQQKANDGCMVIAGLKGNELSHVSVHGHVAMIVAGEIDSVHHQYPLAYWGKFGGIGEKKQWLQFTFNHTDRDKVHYYAKEMSA